MIPSPKQCKDLNSFLIPLLEELLLLEEGVATSKPAAADDVNGPGVYHFVLRTFIIILFGDIPAITKLLAMKGHNAIVPCCACYVQGVLCQLKKNTVYYVPLTLPGARVSANPNNLFLRTHELFLVHYAELDAAKTKSARKLITQDCGINSRPIFASLKLIDLANCTPYDTMHLCFENLVPNLVLHWTAFVGTIPDIAQDGYLYKAEAHAFWIMHIAPIVLKDQLKDKYYR
ncbi:hypothetical protein FRC07_008052, partial [Ceratobasidium sp. 392]